MQRKVLLSVSAAMVIILIVSGCSTPFANLAMRPQDVIDETHGLCYRSDIGLNELGFLKKGTDLYETLCRLGWPSVLASKDEGRLLLYYINDSDTQKCLQLEFQEKKLFSGYLSNEDIFTKKLPEPSEKSDITKYNLKIRKDITRKEAQAIERGMSPEMVQAKLGAPQYVKGNISDQSHQNNIGADATSAILYNPFYYTLADGTTLHIHYWSDFKVDDAWIIEKDGSATSIIPQDWCYMH